MRRTDQWLKEFHPNKPLKDWKDLMSNMKFENSSTKSIKRVSNSSDSNVKHIQPFRKLSSNWQTWRNFTTFTLKSSRKSTLSRRCYGQKFLLRKSTRWKKVQRDMVSNVSNCQKTWNNGKHTSNLRPPSKIWSSYCPLLRYWKKTQSKTDIGKLWMLKLPIEFHLINLKFSLSRT